MYSFQKSLRKADHVRHYSIQTTPSGWEVRAEQDSHIVRQMRYDDWHRVERARRVFALELDSLRENGWVEL
jgi:hypothetical protein